MKQYEAVIKTMEENGGYATLKYLNVNVLNTPHVVWKTKTPFASIRRIVQDTRFFFKIRPGLWALKDYRQKLPDSILGLIKESKTPLQDELKYTHYYYQGMLAEIGTLQNYKVYIPPQDKNRPYLNRTLKDVITLEVLPKFTYEHIINVIKSIDVIWINERGFPSCVFEVENSTDFKNSLIKLYELSDFNSNMVIVSHKSRYNQFNSIIKLSIYRMLKERVIFYSYENIENYFSNPFQFKDAMDLSRI